ncbi:hypothetical protein SAMN05216436_108118 [bacterium A37T11]|nr:hypothetical protein SAMN05216436_108118 [bacterium A37T11]
MKKTLLILLLTSCAGYKTIKQSSDNQQIRDSQAYEQQGVQTSKQAVNLLETYWQRDSLGYQALILTDGPFRINADSGLSGTGARIWLNGTRQRYQTGKKQQDSSRLDSQQTRVMTSKQHQEHQTVNNKSTRHASLNLYWLMLPVILIGLLWFLWKRK